MENNSQIKPASLFGVILLVGMFSLPVMLLLTIGLVLRSGMAELSKESRYLIYMLLGVGLGFLNSTKPVDYSDIGYYYWLYNWSGTKNFIEYFHLIPKEPIYFIYNYLMRYITLGNFGLFMIVSTVLMYFPVMIACDRIFRENGISVKYALICAVIFACFSEYFFYTAQIVRQVLAGSLAFYFIVRMTYSKDLISYIGLACVGLIHASAFVFCVYYVLVFFKRFNLTYRIIALLAFLVLFSTVLGVVSSVSDTGSTLAYAAQRAEVGSADRVTVGLLPLAVCFLIIPMSFFIIWKFKNNPILTNLFLFAIFLTVFVFLNFRSPLFVQRFMEYCYMFLPLCLVLVVSLLKWNRVAGVIMIIMVARFCLKLNNGSFTYESIGEFLVDGYPMMLIKLLL